MRIIIHPDRYIQIYIYISDTHIQYIYIYMLSQWCQSGQSSNCAWTEGHFLRKVHRKRAVVVTLGGVFRF